MIPATGCKIVPLDSIPFATVFYIFLLPETGSSAQTDPLCVGDFQLREIFLLPRTQNTQQHGATHSIRKPLLRAVTIYILRFSMAS